MERAWPLIGRSEELRLVERSLQRPERPRGLVLGGAAGVGKTRLAREAAAIAERRGREVAWVTATSCARRLPLGALAMLVGDVGADEVGLVQRAADRIIARAGETGPALFVDDAHLLDDVSASVIHQLVQHRRADVLLTVRSGEAGPEAVESLWKDRFLDRVEVQPLSRAETEQLLSRALGPMDPVSLRALFALSDGNTLYLWHIVEGELAAGRLAPDRAGRWTWSGDFHPSPALRSLVDQRLRDLGRPELEVLDTLAVGGSVELQVAEVILDVQAIERCEASGLIATDGTEQATELRLGHPLYAEVRIDRVGPIRARRLRERLADALAEHGRSTPAEMLRRAVLLLDAGIETDPDVLLAGARRATVLLDWALGQQLAAAAIRAGAGYEARLTLAYAQGFGSVGRAAEQTLASLVKEATGPELARAALAHAGHSFFTRGRPAEAVEILGSARRRLADTPLVALLDALEGIFEAHVGNPAVAAELGRRALRSEVLPPQAQLLATWGLIGGLGRLGRMGELDREPDAAYDRTADVPEASLPRLGCAGIHVAALLLCGRIEDAAAVAARLRPESSGRSLIADLIGDALEARVLLATGRVAAAAARAADAVGGLSGRDSTGWVHYCLPTLCQASALSGDASGAWQAYRQLRDDPHPAFGFMESEVHLARAWCHAAEGSVTEATSEAHAGARRAAEMCSPAYEVVALATAVRFGDASAAHRLRELCTVVQGPRAVTAADHAAALREGNGKELMAAAGAYAAWGDLLAAADAAAQAAECFRRQGLRGSHHAACVRAARLQQDCDGAVTPALSVALHPLPLTGREREIAMLAARGLANREIADRLVLSVRTVEGHLYRACVKLGIKDRRQLSTLLGGTTPGAQVY